MANEPMDPIPMPAALPPCLLLFPLRGPGAMPEPSGHGSSEMFCLTGVS